jgi:hypothetical protein
VRGEHQHRQQRVAPVHRLKQLQPVHAAHAQVGDQQGGKFVVQLRQRCFATAQPR